MYFEARKVHLIEKLLKVNNEAVLSELETVLKSKRRKDKPSTNTFNEFVGIWTAKEADEVERIIEQSCETIHPDDWK